jgi:VCBS repeat-containing protein
MMAMVAMSAVGALAQILNTPPVAVGDTYNTNEDTTLTMPAPGVLANDTDLEGNPLTAVLVNNVANGTLVLNPNGSFTYTPNANFNGTDSFTYNAKDGTTNSLTPATVTITVNAVNDAPTANAQSVTTNEDVAKAITLVGNDVEGDSLTYTIVSGLSHGTLSGTGASRTYTPAANYNGPDSFTFKATDGTADSNTATVSITVNAVNDAPVAKDDSLTTDEDTAGNGNVLTNDTDADGNTLTGRLVTGPSNGTLDLRSNGSYTYTPNADFNGMDSFTYRACDDSDTCSEPATATITVTAANDAPTINSVANDGPKDEGTPVTITVIGTDTDTPSGDLRYQFDCNRDGDYADAGDVGPQADKSAQCTFPDGGASGTSYTVNVRITDGEGGSAAGSTSVTVRNAAPNAVDDTADAVEDGPNLTINVLGNDTDVAADPLTITGNTQPPSGQGTVTCSTTQCVFDPSADFFGDSTFTYTISDGDGGTDTATVAVTVSAVNDAPVANDDAKTTPENTPLIFPASDLVANDSEGAPNENGQTLSVSQVNNPQNGAVDLDNGQITFTPQTDYNGAASFEYTVCDDGTLQECSTQTAIVNVTVSPVNSKPVAQDGGAVIDEDAAPVQIDFSTLVSDVESSDANLTYTIVSGPTPQQGTLTGSGPSFTFDSAENFNGTVAIDYKVTDQGDPDNCGAPGPSCEASKESDVKTLTITVNPLNDDPVVSSVTNNGQVGEGSPATITVSATDVEGDTLSYEFDCDDDNAFEVGPQPGNSVQCTFNDEGTYRVNARATDGNGGTATGFTDATVNPAVDSTAPWVTTTTPLPGAKKISSKAMVTATFPEMMDPTTLTTSTFTLKKGTTTVLATVSYDTNTNTATLDPSKKLRRGATYVAMVTTGAEDLAGNALAADKAWKFRVRR